jgi:hypothetical protein
MPPSDQWSEQEADRLREIVSLIDSLENRLQKVKTSLQAKESSTQISTWEPGLGKNLKLFLIGIQLELTECPNQISKIQSLIIQLTTMIPYH